MHPVFYAIGNSYCIKSTNAQLAEMNFALQAPFARREFAGKLYFKIKIQENENEPE